MAEYRKDKFYWFRLKEDFFKRHDIKIIKAMPNGKDYVIFYLQLLCESLAHNGNLRFSDTIPYNEQMLSVITETNIDIVRCAMKVFTELGLVEVLDDKTIYMKTLHNMIGSTTDGAEKKQIQRSITDNKKLIGVDKRVDNCPPEIEKEIEIDIEKEIDIKKEKDIRDIPVGKPPSPTKHKHGSFENVLLTDEELEKLQTDYPNADEAIQYLSEYIELKGYKAKSHYLAIRKWVFDALKEQQFRKQALEQRGNRQQPCDNIFLELGKQEGIF